MIRINKAKFQENIVEWEDGIYIFELENCSSCDTYNNLLKDIKSKKSIYLVDCNEDLDYYISLGMDVMPETRLYESGIPKVIVKGLPSKKDLERLFHEEFENSNC